MKICCVSCCSETKRLYNINSNKSIREKHFDIIKEILLPDIEKENTSNICICEHCISLLRKIQTYKSNAQTNFSKFTRSKRLSNNESHILVKRFKNDSNRTGPNVQLSHIQNDSNIGEFEEESRAKSY